MSFIDIDKELFKLSGIIYFILMSLSYILFWNRNELYVRPLGFFVILAISGVVISIQILGAKNTLQQLLVFSEVILLSLTFTLTQQLLYKSPLSRDPWTHWALISQILYKGHIPAYQNIKTPYAYLPNFHLMISTYILVGGVPYKWASYLIIGFSTLALLNIMVYLLGFIVLEKKEISLIGILFLATADNVLDMTGKNIVPNSLGVALALVLFYFMWKYYPNRPRVTLCIYLMTFGLALTHTLSYGMLIQQIAILLLLSLILVRRNDYSLSVARLILVMFIIALFTWGLWAHVYFRSMIMLLESLVKGIEPSKYVAKLSIPIEYVILARLGMIMYYSITGFTALYIFFNQLKRKKIRRELMLVILMVLFFGGIGVFAFLNPRWSGIAHRYWYYGEVIGSVILGNITFYILKKPGYEKLFGSILVFTLIFLMFGASISNDDNPLIKEYSTRTGWHNSEITAGFFAIEKTKGPLASDWDYIMNLNNVKWISEAHPPSNPPKYADIGWIINAKFPKSFSEIFSENGYSFILRKELVKNYAFWLGPRWGMIQYTPLHEGIGGIIKTGNIVKNTIYSSGNVLIWYS